MWMRMIDCVVLSLVFFRHHPGALLSLLDDASAEKSLFRLEWLFGFLVLLLSTTGIPS
jgi:hypothetical protein